MLATLTGLPLLARRGASALLVAALAIALAERLPGIGRDAAIAVVITLAVRPRRAAGAVAGLAARDPRRCCSATCSASPTRDLLLAAVLAAVVIVACGCCTAGCSPSGSIAPPPRAGRQPALVDAALLVLLAARDPGRGAGLGNLLVVAVLVGPASTARLVCRRMPRMMLVAAMLAARRCIGGLYLSYYAGTAAGASIAGTFVVLFLAALGGSLVRDRASAGRRTRPPGAATPASANP